MRSLSAWQLPPSFEDPRRQVREDVLVEALVAKQPFENVCAACRQSGDGSATRLQVLLAGQDYSRLVQPL